MAASRDNEQERAAPKPLDEIERDIAANTRAYVVGPYLQKRGVAADANQRSFAARLDEAAGLAAAIDLTVVEPVQVLLTALRPATYLGKGKVEELAERIKLEEIGLVVMDCALSPVQQRNLEKAFGCKVIDRTGLILEIFGDGPGPRRARSRSSSRISITRKAGWSAPGPISNASAAASASSAARARPRSRPTGASSDVAVAV
ncbi:GTPase HflX [Bosea thiooxidans]